MICERCHRDVERTFYKTHPPRRSGTPKAQWLCHACRWTPKQSARFARDAYRREIRAAVRPLYAPLGRDRIIEELQHVKGAQGPA